MRLSKYLSLSIAMSRNQARFFIRKGRVYVGSDVITDPNFELADTDLVFYASALDLLKDRADEHYFYFANVVGPELTGLVLFSDDARWASRMQRRVLRRPCVYHARSKERFGDDKYEQINSAWLESTEAQISVITDIRQQDDRTLVLSTNQPQVQGMMEIFSSVGLPLETLRLQQLGKLNLGDLAEGDYLQLNKSEIEI